MMPGVVRILLSYLELTCEDHKPLFDYFDVELLRLSLLNAE
jgi:hypothetical protein